MFEIDTSSQSDKIKISRISKILLLDTQVGGGQDKLAWTAYPPLLQFSIQNILTKKTAEFDLNYVYY